MMRKSTMNKRTLQKLGTAKKLHSEIINYRKDINSLAMRCKQLVKKYPNEWIAFSEGRVVARAKTLDGLLKITDRKNLSRNKIITQYLRTGKMKIIV